MYMYVCGATWAQYYTIYGLVWARMGPCLAHMNPHRPAWARPGPIMKAKPFWKFANDLKFASATECS